MKVDEDTIPSTPKAVDFEMMGGRVFERLRRKNVGGRRCAPCDNSWVAVDRIIFNGQPGFLFHRNHNCSSSLAIKDDLIARDLTAVGFEVLGQHLESDGHLAVITSDCPGIRLRALVEVLRMSNATLPHEVAWYVILRTAELCRVWLEIGIQPLDTFIGFDGSLHLFPSMPACWQAEMPSFMGNEVFDPLLVDTSIPKLDQLLCAALPLSVFGFPEAVASTKPAISLQVQAFLDGPRTTGDTAPLLASLVRQYFPKAYARHRQVYQSLGRDLDTNGLVRERRILDRL